MSVSQPTTHQKANGHLERGPAWHRSTTRKAILEAARELIERDGLEKTSLLRVAEHTGFAPTTVYAYFVRKADLISAIVADDLASFAKKIKEDFPFSEPLYDSGEGEESGELTGLVPANVALTARALARIEAPNPAADLYTDAQMPETGSLTSERGESNGAHGFERHHEKFLKAVHSTSSHDIEADTQSAHGLGDHVIAAFEARIAELEARRVDPWLERRLREFERMLNQLGERVGAATETKVSAYAEARLQELSDRLEAFEQTFAAAQEEVARASAEDANAHDAHLRQEQAELHEPTLETSGRLEALERDRQLHALAAEMPAVDFAPREPIVAPVETVEVEPVEMPSSEVIEHVSQDVEHSEQPFEAAETSGPDESYLAAARRAAQTAQSLAQVDDEGAAADRISWVTPRTRILLSVCVGLGVVLLAAGLLLSGRSSRTTTPAQVMHVAKLLVPPVRAAHSNDFSGVYSAALAGDTRAQLQIGLTYLGGHGVTEDDPRAAHWLESAALSGNAVAQYWLATLFEHGKGETADPTQAIRWYEAAALQGNMKAMYKLAVSHAEGWGTPQNYGEAARWFSRAAELGFVNAQYNLGVLYERGFGVPQSLPDAYKWYGIAAAQGDKDSAARVDALSSQLGADDLATARAQVTAFKAQALNAEANDLPALPSPNAHAPAAQPPKS